MLIDWFTVSAQALNFFILVWLLKKFLYQPILDAIDAREKRVASELESAASTMKEANEARDKYQKNNSDLLRDRESILEKATQEAGTERQRLLDEAREEVRNFCKKRHEDFESEARTLKQALRQFTAKEVYSITRKALKDLADKELEDQVVRSFTKKINDLDPDAKQTFLEAIEASGKKAILSSAHDISNENLDLLKQALTQSFSADIELQPKVDPELICGIELFANGRKLAWNISEYLTSLENEFIELVKVGNREDSVTESVSQ